MNDIYDEFSEVLGAYALDAVDVDERDRIELHLASCPRCRAEVAEHREVAALLSQSGATAPDGVWDRIASELAPPAPPLRMTIAPVDPMVGDERPLAEVDRGATGGSTDSTVAPAVPISSARSATRNRTMLAVLAVAACIVAVLGFVTVSQSRRINTVEQAMKSRSIEAMANDTVADARVKVELTGDAGDAEAVVGTSGQGYLIMGDMPAPADGELYQLWGKVDGTVLSLGTFGGSSSVVPFSVDPTRLDDIELFAVTQEKAPGVVTSANDPVMAGTV